MTIQHPPNQNPISVLEFRNSNFSAIYSIQKMIASIKKHFTQFLAEKLGLQISSLEFEPVGGGSINDTFQVKINNKIKFFLKLNSARRYPALFEKEKNGLEFLSKQKIIYTPAVIDCKIMDDHQLLLLEWIEGGLKTEQFWKQF